MSWRSNLGSFLAGGYLRSASDIDHTSLRTWWHPFACVATKILVSWLDVLAIIVSYNLHRFLHETQLRDPPYPRDEEITYMVLQMTIDTAFCL